MASVDDNLRGSEPNYQDVTTEDQQLQLSTFIDQYQAKLPIVGTVYGEKHVFTYAEFSSGDKLRFLSIRNRIRAQPLEEEPEYEIPTELTSGYLPDDYPGTFQISSAYPDGHTFDNVAQLADDFPPYVIVNEELEIKELQVTISPGDRLKLIHIGTDGEQRWIECKHIKTDTILSLPLDMELRVSKKKDTLTYQANELMERLPVRVRKMSDMGIRIRGLNLHIPGIADEYNGDIMLTQTKIIEVELQDGTEKKIEIPSTFNISVVPFDPNKERILKYGPTANIHDIAKNVVPGKPIVASLTGFPKGSSDASLEEYGLEINQMVIVHSVELKEAILVKGQHSGLLIPIDFRGEFKILADTFRTPYDLIKAGFKGNVRATNTCDVPEDIRDQRLHAIYEFDILEAVSDDIDNLQSILMTRSEDTVDVVELKRTMSTKGHLGVISVPGHVEANLVASTPSTKHHKLFRILQNDWAAFKVAYTQPPNDALTEEDVLLVKESPFQILGLYRYSVTYVTEYDAETSGTGMTREIPEYAEVQARQLLPEPFVMGDIDKKASRASVTKLPAQIFERLATIVKPSNAPYEDVDNLVNKRLMTPTIAPKPKAALPIGQRTRCPTPPPSSDVGEKDKASATQKAGVEEATAATNGKNTPRSVSVDESGNQTTLHKLSRKQSLQVRMHSISLKSKFHTFKAFGRSRPRIPKFTEVKPKTKAKDIPALEPPKDGNIADFTCKQVAGLMRHLEFSDKIVEHCLSEEIDGKKLCLMNSHTDEKIKEELKLENKTQYFAIRPFIEKSVSR